MLGTIRPYKQSLERYGMLMSAAVQVQGHGALRDRQSSRSGRQTTYYLQPVTKEGSPVAGGSLSQHVATSPSP